MGRWGEITRKALTNKKPLGLCQEVFFMSFGIGIIFLPAWGYSKSRRRPA
jgi:hypothetical protein